ncbi:unnamed protein product [Chondrus crispus]|uniref:Uncharacterized protein n=1 Tax=Chondrus crispus TaxID=2769 RepID=R7Q9S1_CHOCR|nr:unnamed protein product [Chondrus crispus]CDF34503.1 unnamed protein product [Chondrus crispus]|eukprot:XP_005714322.1 unnamed protein product [Chondrus crispus]
MEGLKRRTSEWNTKRTVGTSTARHSERGTTQQQMRPKLSCFTATARSYLWGYTQRQQSFTNDITDYHDSSAGGSTRRVIR